MICLTNSKSRLYRNSELLSRIKFGNGGSWFGPREVSSIMKGFFETLPKILKPRLSHNSLQKGVCDFQPLFGWRTYNTSVETDEHHN